MVLSGFTSQRVVLRTVFMLMSLLLGAPLRAQPADVAGTMPEDYLPELKQVLATALQRSPETILRAFEVELSQARLQIERSAQLPQLRGNFNYGMTETATASNTSSKTRDNGFFYNFGLSQEVFHWGALKNKSDAARLNVLIQDRSYVQAYRDLSVMLRRAYLALVVEKARLRQGREALHLLDDDVAIAKAKKASGSISAAALASEELRLRESKLELDRAETEFAANRARFARLAGLPELPEDKLPAEIPRPAYSETRTAAMGAVLLRDHAKSTLEYEIYDLRVKEAELREKVEKVRLLPKFGANIGYSLENTTNVNGNIAEQRAVARQTIGIGGAWNIFDGFATRGAKREALAARRVIEQRRAIDIEELLQRAQKLQRDLQLDATQLELGDIHAGMAAEARRRAGGEAGFGLIPKGEIKRAEIGILQAQARNFEMRAAYLGHWAEFVAVAADDPVLNNIPARYAREKK